MRVSAGSDYALRALIELGRSDSDQPMSAEEISRRQGVPHNFLLAILADLKRAGMVTSHRGKAGGWRIAGDLADVTVADVIRAVDAQERQYMSHRVSGVQVSPCATSEFARRMGR